MKLYLVRHGETEANLSGVYSGITDLPLNTNGISQAVSLSAALSSIEFGLVVTSGLIRTQQTAAYLVSTERLECRTMAEFNEINFGRWEGKHYRDIALNDAAAYAEWAADWQNVAPPDGESFEQFFQRVQRAFLLWLNQNQQQSVLLVGHQGTLRCILLTLLGLPASAFWHFTFTQGAYSVIDIQQGHAVIEQINVMAVQR